MNEKIFRKKSLARMKSPDDLNDYIRISEPGIWLLVAAMAILLAGAFLWGMAVFAG